MKDSKSQLVIDNTETLFIATTVGQSINREDGRNINSIVAEKADNAAKVRYIMKQKKSAVSIMENNYFDQKVLRVHDACDENRTIIEYR